MSEWISVKDRLPENEQVVLICAKRRRYCYPDKFIRIIAKAFYTDGKHDADHSAYRWDYDVDMYYDEERDAYIVQEGWWESVEYAENFYAVDDEVTHWMPFPEKPKEE